MNAQWLMWLSYGQKTVMGVMLRIGRRKPQKALWEGF